MIRHPVALLLAVMLAGFSWFAVRRAQRLSGRDLAVLTGQMDSLASDWEAKQVPRGRRAVTVLLSDAQAASDPLLLAPAPKSGLVDTAGGWISRNLIGGDPAVDTPTELARAFAGSTALVGWTHEGFSTVSEEAMSREVEKAVIRAHDAGAQIDIVAQGPAAAPVLMALKRLEGIGVNKVVLVGMDLPSLKRLPSIADYDFTRLGDATELANIWVPREEFVRKTLMQVSGKGREGETIRVEEVWPDLAGRSAFAADFLPLLRRLLERGETLERSIAQQEQALRDAAQARRQEVEGRAGIEWVMIPGGQVAMGSDKGGAGPRHQAAIKTFQLAKTEVTFAQYGKCVRAKACSPAHVSDGSCNVWTGSRYRKGTLPASLQGDAQPVVCVDWDQAQAYAKWAGGRLPSEAEWEYAARSGGRDRDYPWGDEPATCERAVMGDGGNGCGRNASWPVCSKPRGNTSQGLCDMAGNVCEWTQDWFHDSYAGAPADGSAWESPAGSSRVDRGGSWRSLPESVRAAFRRDDFPDAPGEYLGLRPAKSAGR
ncbi:MAG: SUMF1/EgtB/PvdO family nonheme iron enzyme [Elusimicrobia bacterium]|nr:SUMF1/EgtB/PvdO family nonheme iron enzyme [Elusimicrobiota bacterium]